jgi:PAS domain S-box-containing protein
VIRVNEGWRTLARANGAPPDLVEGLGVDYFEVCRRAGQHDPDSGAILAGMQAVLAGTQPRFDHEYACHTLTGTRWYAGRITRLDSATPGLVVSHTDITERTLAVIRLAREAARYQAILRTASDGIHIFDSTGTVIEASESFWRLLGHDPAAPPALSIDAIDAGLDGEDPDTAFERLYAVPRLVETRYRGKDGILIDVEVDTHGTEVEGQRLVYASARDIRRRRGLETALTEHIARLHRQFENLRVLSEIAAMRPEAEGGRVAQALAIGRRHLGLPAGFLVRVQGGHCALVHRDTDPPDLGPEVGTLLALDQTISATTIATGDVVAIPDMTTVPQAVPPLRSDWGIASYIGAPVPVAGGVFGALAFCGSTPYPRAFDEGDAEFTRLLARWIGAVIDEEMIRQTLAASNAELEQFAYVASHDLRQPLRQIASFVSLLERRYGDRLDDEARSYIAFAREGAVRMDTLIVDLLEFSRVGRDGREAAPIALGPVVERVVVTLSRLIGESGASIEIAPYLPTVRGTVTDLTRLFQNLITNAITYRRPDAPPRVRITSRADGKSQVVTVSDNGIGIEPAYFETIFRIFQRLHTPDRYEGTGIGLAICKKVVEQMNGRIWVDSAVGQGSSFHVAFPSQTP